jgi:hypothetical protein
MDEQRMSILIQLLLLAACFGAGLGLGWLYFQGLWWNVCQFAGGGRALTFLFLAIGRFLFLGAILLLVSLMGALPLLAATLGVLAARFITLRHVYHLAP